MILIREGQEATVHATSLQDIEWRQALRDGQPVIQLIMDDEVWRPPLFDVLRRIPLRVCGVRVAELAAEIVDGEEELFAADLVPGREDTVVGHEGDEFAAERLPLDPVDLEWRLACSYFHRVCG